MLTALHSSGYKINNGNVNDLTPLQRIAIYCMKRKQREYNLENKAFFVVD